MNRECEHRFKAETELISKKIFISYGHKDAQKLAFRLEEDLKEKGHDVWLDKHQMRAAESWEQQIQDAILNRELFITLLSPHAVRRSDGVSPDGVCLDEISMARYESRKIIPVMVLKCRPPLGIYRLDWIDFLNWEIPNQYDQAFQRLLKTIDLGGDVKGHHARIFSQLNPLDFGAEIARLTHNFTGREWLLEDFNDWLQNEESRVFFITGDPGIGKSAIMAYLVHKHEQVLAYHFCSRDVPDSLNPNQFFKSVAAQLATQMENYREALEGVDLEGVIDSGDPGTLLRRVIIDPLKAEHPDKPVIIVVDGLDEAFAFSPPNIVTILRDQLKDLPAWMRLVLSSRKVPKILDYFNKFKPHEIEAFNQENVKDVRSYLEKRLKESEIVKKLLETGASTKTVVDTIFEKGEGNFLYVKEAIDGIKAGLIDPSHPETFPKGLIEIYIISFERIFPETQEYEKLRPILDVLIAAREPLTAKQIGFFIDRDGFEVRKDLQKIASFFPERDGRYQNYHGSITEWLLGEVGHDLTYQVNVNGGHRLIAEKVLKAYRDGKEDSYMLEHLSHHLLFLKKWDELAELLSDPKYMKRIDIFQLSNFPESLLNIYYGVKPEQTKVLLDLKKLAGKALPRVEKIDAYIPYGKDEKEYDTFGVKIDGNNVVGLALCYSILTTLPESIRDLKSLQELYLRGNKLSTLPESIGDLKSLQILNLRYNQLSTLPESLSNLKSLQTLDLWGNKLTTLPESLSNLKSLQELYLRGNNLSTLPESITKLISLQTLDLGFNNLMPLPESIGNLSSLQELWLHNNNLTILPDSIGDLKSLQILNLRGNNLSTLPESIGDLKSLQELNLNINELSTLPESIGHLSSLQTLRLWDNKLSTLPESIGNLKSLQILYLFLNQLTTFPESIGNLSSLQKLNLGYNKFATLPESIGNLKLLEELWLTKNYLTTLPESITNLKSLQTLGLSGNQLTTLPESIKILEKRGVTIYK